MNEDGFDYVIVGAGSAGCVLACRLSEDPDCEVLLLEAGAPPSHPLVPIVGAAPNLWDTEVDWGFRSEPQEHLNGRRIQLPRGKTLGGSSQLNFCVYIRGNRGDYDHWAQLGNTGWGYDDVLPYFRRAETNASHDDEWHGTTGPLSVEEFQDRHPLHEMYLEALEGLGVPRNPDFNGERQEGCGYYQATLKGGRRCSTADGHLATAIHRPNLTVVTGAHVTGLAMERSRCLGVDYVVGRHARRARARRETILSAGSIGSPHIMLLSGIGPADEIAKHGIDPVLDLPGVGRNLLDHIFGPIVIMAVKEPGSLGFDNPSHDEALARFEQDRTGPFSTLLDIGAFVRTREVDADPSAQLLGALTSRERFRHVAPPGLALSGYVCRTLSRGSVTLATASPFDRPRIDPRYFSEPEDLARHVEVIEFNREIAHHAAFAKVRDKVIAPPTDRDALIAAIRETASTTWHQSSTCRMGVDDDAVVSPDLKVRGLEGLRVCDASIMPAMVSGNLNAPTIMIGEKGADLVKSGS